MSLGLLACHLDLVNAVSLEGTAEAKAKTKWFMGNDFFHYDNAGEESSG